MRKGTPKVAERYVNVIQSPLRLDWAVNGVNLGTKVHFVHRPIRYSFVKERAVLFRHSEERTQRAPSISPRGGARRTMLARTIDDNFLNFLRQPIELISIFAD